MCGIYGQLRYYSELKGKRAIKSWKNLQEL